MSDPKIAELLAQLHERLDRAPAVSEQDRALLRRIADDIDALLASSGAEARRRHRTVLDQLEEAVVQFEAEHPELTVTLGSISKALGDMGI